MNIIKSGIIYLHGAANSMRGGRPENQDDLVFLDTPLGFLIVICDGMGGGPGGKTASSIAKYEIANTLCECTPQTPRDHALKMATSRANEALERKMQEVPSLQGMGSTFVAVLINNDSAYVAHAGDSRCYLLRDDKCVYRSQDHSLVGELVRKKVLTEEEARLSPQSNIISRGLGNTTNHVPDIEEIFYKKGDRFILCTDGIWGIMPHDELIKRLSQKTDIQRIVSNLSSEVDNIGYSKGGHHDNHTIAVFETEHDSRLKTKINWRKIAITCSLICLFAVISACALFLILKKDAPPGTSPIGVSSDSTYKGDSGTNYSSATSSTDTTSMVERSNGSDTVSKKTASGNTDTVMKQLSNAIDNKGRDVTKQKNDSASKKKTEQTSKMPSETTQKVINRYNSAKAAEGATVEEAQKKLDGLRKEIKALMNELHKQCENSKALPTVEAVGRVVDDKASWYVSKEKDKTTGKYKPTQNAQELMNKQIKRLTELKSKLLTWQS